jgi:hypothetical protein
MNEQVNNRSSRALLKPAHKATLARRFLRWLKLPNCYGRIGCPWLPRFRNDVAYLQACPECLSLFFGDVEGKWKSVGFIWWLKSAIAELTICAKLSLHPGSRRVQDKQKSGSSV